MFREELRKRNRTGDVDTISRLHFVHQVVVGVHHGGVGGLTGRHVLRRLLQLDLAESEHT